MYLFKVMFFKTNGYGVILRKQWKHHWSSYNKSSVDKNQRSFKTCRIKKQLVQKSMIKTELKLKTKALTLTQTISYRDLSFTQPLNLKILAISVWSTMLLIRTRRISIRKRLSDKGQLTHLRFQITHKVC